MKDFEKLKKTSIEDLQKEISAEIDYLLRGVGSCYEGDNKCTTFDVVHC